MCTALKDAVSIASLLITTEAMVAEKPKKETAVPAMPPRARTTERPHIGRSTTLGGPGPRDEDLCLAVASRPAPLSLLGNESGQAGKCESGYCHPMSLIRRLDNIACIFPTNE